MRSKSTLVAVIYLAGFGISAWTLNKVFAGLFAQFAVANRAILGDNLALSGVAGAVVAAAVMGYLWVSKRSKNFVGEVVDEVGKVAWPHWDETRTNTVVVVVFSFIAAGILGVFDTIFSWLSSADITKYFL